MHMPTLAVIDGIKIQMFYLDHDPPHFHAVYGEHEVLVSIADLRVIDGTVPAAITRKVIDWASMRQDALAFCWVCCRSGKKPGKMN